MADPKHLMARYCAGDASAFRELYRVVAPEVLRYFVAMAHPNAPDLVQQTFLELHRARSTYIRDADPIPWIYAIAQHVVGSRARTLGA